MHSHACLIVSRALLILVEFEPQTRHQEVIMLKLYHFNLSNLNRRTKCTEEFFTIHGWVRDRDSGPLAHHRMLYH